ncbi:MAG: 2-oxoadipate dioxygenase/decarboxylase family protein [Planctomycetota bacterium]
MTTFATGSTRANRIEMQNRLFGALSAMFGKEVPLYDKSLVVNKACNETVCALLSRLHPGFAMGAEELERTSGERHGAIRIGRPDEYRWIGRLFACFAMEPHNFYDMTNVGAKSQPIIATAFRSVLRPEHRVFSSVLMTDYFDPATKERIEGLLSKRTVFSDRAKQLIEKCEQGGGLDWNDGEALIKECTDRIFKWTGKARDHALYKELSAAGFKIAADISCFQSHHLNHLTPNTFCMDLYTAAMKRCLGEVDAAWFEARATTVLGRLAATADKDFMKLHFKHVPLEEISAWGRGSVDAALVAKLAKDLGALFSTPAYDLSKLNHAGFKDFTEGPSEDTPVLLRQDAYKALTEPVEFAENDGSTVGATHTARFGEIEERFYACTPKGRAMYDACLAEADAAREKDPGLPKRDMAAYEALYAKPFAAFPKSLAGLIESRLVYARYVATPKGIAAKGALPTTDLLRLAADGFVEYEGLRYEDFLPVSAAGIFASNLQQYGTKSTAAVKPTYTQKQLEEILGKRIIDSTTVYAGVEAESKLEAWTKLGLIERIPAAERAELENAVAAYRAIG